MHLLTVAILIWLGISLWVGLVIRFKLYDNLFQLLQRPIIDICAITFELIYVVNKLARIISLVNNL